MAMMIMSRIMMIKAGDDDDDDDDENGDYDENRDDR